MLVICNNREKYHLFVTVHVLGCQLYIVYHDLMRKDSFHLLLQLFLLLKCHQAFLFVHL